jgi:hypothetical protein
MFLTYFCTPLKKGVSNFDSVAQLAEHPDFYREGSGNVKE